MAGKVNSRAMYAFLKTAGSLNYTIQFGRPRPKNGSSTLFVATLMVTRWGTLWRSP